MCWHRSGLLDIFIIEIYLIEVPVLNLGSEWSLIFVLVVSFIPLSTMFISDYGSILTVGYFSFFHFIIKAKILLPQA